MKKVTTVEADVSVALSMTFVLVQYSFVKVYKKQCFHKSVVFRKAGM